jgi:hypothetical protein
MRLDHYSVEKDLETRFQELHRESEMRRLRKIARRDQLARKTIAFGHLAQSFILHLLGWIGICP